MGVGEDDVNGFVGRCVQDQKRETEKSREWETWLFFEREYFLGGYFWVFGFKVNSSFLLSTQLYSIQYDLAHNNAVDEVIDKYFNYWF